METIKIPGPMRLVWGSLGAWWLAYILNPGFHSISVLLLFLVPVVVKEIYSSPRSEKPTPPTVELLEANDTAQENAT